METKLVMVEKLMSLMNKQKINRVEVDGIRLEVNHFMPAPPTAEELQLMKERFEVENEKSAMDTLLYSTQ